jgi:uncharacterized protein YdiU (UPF0061 family)
LVFHNFLRRTFARVRQIYLTPKTYISQDKNYSLFNIIDSGKKVGFSKQLSNKEFYMKYFASILVLLAVFLIYRFTMGNLDQIPMDKKVSNTVVEDKNVRHKLSEIIGQYKGVDKASLMAKMAKDLLADERKMFMEELVKSFESKDEAFVTFYISKLPKLKMHPEEIEQIKQLLKNIKDEPAIQAKWNEYENVFKEMGQTIN